jgi:hypothetical protein
MRIAGSAARASTSEAGSGVGEDKLVASLGPGVESALMD